MAGTAGAVGAFVGTPADVALVRMTTDGRLPVGNDKFLYKCIDFHQCQKKSLLR